MPAVKSRIHFIANLFEGVARNPHLGLKEGNRLGIEPVRRREILAQCGKRNRLIVPVDDAGRRKRDSIHLRHQTLKVMGPMPIGASSRAGLLRSSGAAPHHQYGEAHADQLVVHIHRHATAKVGQPALVALPGQIGRKARFRSDPPILCDACTRDRGQSR